MDSQGGLATHFKDPVLSQEIDHIYHSVLDILSALSESARKDLVSRLCSTLLGIDGSTIAHVPTFLPAEAPRLPLFSGNRIRKGEVTYTQWRYDLMCLEFEQTWPSAVLLQAIRKSLRGIAHDALQNLGMQVTVQQVVSKLDSMFGTVTSPEQLLENFYVSKQASFETIAQWGTRLEDLAREAQEADSAASATVRDTLCGKFFSGLSSQHIKSCIRHRFDAGESFDQLLRAARIIEEEQAQEKGKDLDKQPVRVSQQQRYELKELSEMEEVTPPVVHKMTETIEHLTGHITILESRLKSLQVSSRPTATLR